MEKIVLFGDSLFNGFRDHHNTNLVLQPLREKLAGLAEIENISKSGATTVEGVDYLSLIPQDADLIVLEYGTNDSSYLGISCENYAQNLEKMIDYCLPKKIIIVGPWQDKSGNSYTIPENLDENRKIAKNLALKYQQPFIDLLQMRKNEKDLDKLYQNDGLHLTDYGNAKLITLLVNMIKKELV